MSVRRSAERPLVGAAYAAYIPDLLRRRPGLLDFVELPFERLRHDSQACQILGTVPTILHCASLSVAGVVPAPDSLLKELAAWSSRTNTPWIGEHLAFVTAPGSNDTTIEIGYTVAPPLNESSLHRVVTSCRRYERTLRKQIILENPPQYFVTPGSTMTQAEFLCALCEVSEVELLLDLSHFFITARNSGRNPQRAVQQLPLERTKEIHLSGVRKEMSTFWDDHGVATSRAVFELLGIALQRARPKAITLEYNWSATFPEELIVEHLTNVRALAARAH